MSESIARDSRRSGAPTLGEGAIGCIYQSDDALDAATSGLLHVGISSDALHLGAADEDRARAAADRTGIAADLHPDDPFLHILAPGHADRARAAIDRAGLIGALTGALFGILVSFTPLGAVVPTHPAPPIFANLAFWFVIGAIVGSVLGAALAPQPSTHVGFRLIDGMQEGAYAFIVVAPLDRLDDVQKVLEASGGTGITRV